MEILRKITSLSHPIVKHLVKLRQNHHYRYDQQTAMVAGIKQVAEICQHCTPKLILTYDETFLPKEIHGSEVILVNEAIMQKVSGMVNPEALLVEVPLPKENSLNNMQYIVALDSINDPGNMGTLLRSALALGWEGVFILGNSCDPFNEKAIRSGRGACFRLPLRHGSWKELEELVQKNSLTPFLADLEGTPPEKLSFKNGALIILSNEANGPSNKAKEICQKVTIPIVKEMESLNVAAAGAILMYILRNR